MTQFNIPLSCPSCDGRMYVASYDSSLKILKNRSWQVCYQCGFERETEQFKKELITV
ncbi:hypothetical protein [Nitrosopumilus sp.]|uniref:hypothetical protein n=1 Tax=Nitrosopumilus sp. TaxID=2024843 RepID=UPI0029302348|nr:hypothetical protein [Nitrosopumilus sp.]